jgi:hypothetical protein
VIKTYKAGSGQVKNTCAVGKGWLPNAGASKPYAVQWHRKNFDGIINGFVIKISDRKCHNGTKRTELFIHSEMKPNGKQGTIESERWTNSGPNDYYSNGCIKLNPTNIKDLFKRLDHVGWSRTGSPHRPARSCQLLVPSGHRSRSEGRARPGGSSVLACD